jgi:hypothetical protein
MDPMLLILLDSSRPAQLLCRDDPGERRMPPSSLAGQTMRRYVLLAWLPLSLALAPAAWAGPEDEICAVFERFVAAQNASARLASYEFVEVAAIAPRG